MLRLTSTGDGCIPDVVGPIPNGNCCNQMWLLKNSFPEKCSEKLCGSERRFGCIAVLGCAVGLCGRGECPDGQLRGNHDQDDPLLLAGLTGHIEELF